jgi:hypothetical protein
MEEIWRLNNLLRVLSAIGKSTSDLPVMLEIRDEHPSICVRYYMATGDKSKSISGRTCHFAFEPDRDGILQ